MRPEDHLVHVIGIKGLDPFYDDLLEDRFFTAGLKSWEVDWRGSCICIATQTTSVCYILPSIGMPANPPGEASP